MHAIETSQLTKRFRHVEAVKDLDLSIDTGSIYALMGPNGAGKTTLIKLLMNLIGPTSGHASMLGADSRTLRGRKLQSIGYVSENQRLLDWMTVDEFLGYCRPFYPTWDAALERQLVDRFALPRRRRLKHLSRGVRMKAALASALLFRPQLLVLDEPLSGLDPLVRDELMEALVAEAGGTTVLISSHDLAEIDSFASHVGFMDNGHLQLSEPISNVRNRFRRVEITSDAPLPALAARPPEWSRFSLNGQTASWRETSWELERSEARIREAFGAVHITTEPMALREIFLSLAKPAGSSSEGGSR